MVRCVLRYFVAVVGGLALLTAPGCQTKPAQPVVAPAPLSTATVLMPGDDIEIAVFATPELNTVQKVRPDGKIAVKLFGEIHVAGKEPMQVQQDLIALYEKQIQVKAITVIARSSAAVYVTGAVIRPGKVDFLRPMTVLEAISECGGFDPRAGARRSQVRVLRREGNLVQSHLLDLDAILTRGESAPFFLRPFDTVFVPGSW
jgi:polysaccharide export outer membrane protein